MIRSEFLLDNIVFPYSRMGDVSCWLSFSFKVFLLLFSKNWQYAKRPALFVAGDFPQQI